MSNSTVNCISTDSCSFCVSQTTVKIESRERLAKIVRNTRGEQTQRAYAKKLNVSYAAIQDWEKAKTIPGTDNLEKIARSAGLTLQELIEYLEHGYNEDERVPTTTILREIDSMPVEDFMKVADVVFTRLKQVTKSSFGKNEKEQPEQNKKGAESIHA